MDMESGSRAVAADGAAPQALTTGVALANCSARVTLSNACTNSTDDPQYRGMTRRLLCVSQRAQGDTCLAGIQGWPWNYDGVFGASNLGIEQRSSLTGADVALGSERDA
ncbi:hypothetical protein ATCC90586_008790 [Pythium insidiosum]|nr:hypothetical protein ATCC90586_008790 [Pythium insidiosum]